MAIKGIKFKNSGQFQKGHKDLVPKEKRGHTEKTKEKISKSQIGRVGEESNAWKGGITIIDRLIRRMSEYYQWRSNCFQRDKWTCKTCGKNDCYVTVHHIKGLNKIIRENNIKDILMARNCKEIWDTNNGITLCEDCHKLNDNYKGKAKNRGK